MPSALAPISTSWIWARPWIIEIIDSDRVSTHRTGRPSRRAAAAITGYSA